MRRVRLADVPDSPSSPPESQGPRPTPGARRPRRARSLSAGRLPHVRSCRRHREALPAPPGSEQRRRADSDSDAAIRVALPKLPAAGRHAGLLRWTPRRSQRPAAGPAEDIGAGCRAVSSIGDPAWSIGL